MIEGETNNDVINQPSPISFGEKYLYGPRRFIGSRLALALGIILALVNFGALLISRIGGFSWPTTDRYNFITPFLIILGALAYRSLKKTTLGLSKFSADRRALEIGALLIVCAAAFFEKYARQALISGPVNGSYLYPYYAQQLLNADRFTNVVLPIWIVLAYAVLYLLSRLKTANGDGMHKLTPKEKKILLAVGAGIIVAIVSVIANNYFRISDKITAKRASANWQVYYNSQHGFTVKYPKDWEVYESFIDLETGRNSKFGRVVLRPKNLSDKDDTKGAGIMIGEAQGDLVKANLETLDPQYYQLISNKKLRLAGMDATELVVADKDMTGNVTNTSRQIIFSKNRVAFYLIAPNDDLVGNQILSTFEFAPKPNGYDEIAEYRYVPQSLIGLVKSQKLDKEVAIWLGRGSKMDVVAVFASLEDKKEFLSNFSKNDYTLLEDYEGFETVYMTVPSTDSAIKILQEPGVVRFSAYGWNGSHFDVNARNQSKTHTDNKYFYQIKVPAGSSSNFKIISPQVLQAGYYVPYEMIYWQIRVFEGKSIEDRIKEINAKDMLRLLHQPEDRNVEKKIVDDIYLGGKKGKAVIFTLAPEDDYSYVLAENNGFLYEFFTLSDLNLGGEWSDAYSTFKFTK